MKKMIEDFAMSNRIQTAFPDDKPMPANIFPDLNWVSANRLDLYKKYGDCVVVVYQQKIIGRGSNRTEALADAEAHLAEDVEFITPAIGYISNPYRIGHLQRKVNQE
jgi:hypothetical protein